MATDLIALENDLIARLTLTCHAMGVSVNKLNAYALKQPVQSGQVFVNYGGSQTSEPLTFNSSRVTTFSFQVLVRFTNLTTHDQAYPLLMALRDRLRDYEPVSELCTKPMHLLREVPPTLDQQLDGFWLYTQIYEFDLLEV